MGRKKLITRQRGSGVFSSLIPSHSCPVVDLPETGSMSLDDIAANPELKRFAAAGGRSAFLVNCVQCHGSGAAGSAGYPNLNDDDWLWGGSLQAIHATITHGIRFVQDPDTRVSEMPAFGADQILNGEQISATAEYVLLLAGEAHDATLADRGRPLFAENCAACHGETGGGGRDFGAPRLTDGIWLYGRDRRSIVAQITRPRHGVMPAWAGRLGPATVKELALYVHSLGGGEAEVAAK